VVLRTVPPVLRRLLLFEDSRTLNTTSWGSDCECRRFSRSRHGDGWCKRGL